MGSQGNELFSGGHPCRNDEYTSPDLRRPEFLGRENLHLAFISQLLRLEFVPNLLNHTAITDGQDAWDVLHHQRLWTKAADNAEVMFEQTGTLVLLRTVVV